jgi:hypothetical protein
MQVCLILAEWLCIALFVVSQFSLELGQGNDVYVIATGVGQRGVLVASDIEGFFQHLVALLG